MLHGDDRRAPRQVRGAAQLVVEPGAPGEKLQHQCRPGAAEDHALPFGHEQHRQPGQRHHHGEAIEGEIEQQRAQQDHDGVLAASGRMGSQGRARASRYF